VVPHDHAHHHQATGVRLQLALALTAVFVAIEGAAGFWTGSLALLSDAGHNLADTLALGLSWYAHALSARKADAKRTFGYHRVGVLAALANAVVLVVIALGIFWESWARLRAPAAVPGALMMAVAGAALGVNLMVSWWLSHGRERDVNLRSAYLHMLADAASSAGVIVAGAVVLATGWTSADAVASAVIAVLILWSSWSILEETVGILLEAAPARLDVEAVGKAIRTVPGVLSVHDLHAWTLGSGIVACSCHIVIAEQTASAGQEVVRAVGEALERFDIVHSTVQVEVESCATPSQGLYCVGEDPHGHHEHDHASHDHHDHDHAHHGHGHAH
jgi:cobalt-zinc-cadmium efflux system protein